MTPPDPAGRVVVVGSVNVDRTVTAPRFPRPGETITGASVSTTTGGKGANQAVAAARAGARTTFVGRVGADDVADLVVGSLTAEHIDVRVARVADAPTGTAWITVAESDNQIVVVPGANHRWDDVADVRTASSPTDVLLLQAEIPVEVVALAADAARTAGATVVLNAAPAFRVDDALLRSVDVLVVNEHELGIVSGLPTAADDEVFTAHRALRARGASAVVTTRGPLAVLATGADGLEASTPAPAAANVIDTTGAGDAFCGVLAARLAAGDPLDRAIAWGAAAGSASVEAATAQASYPTHERLRTLVEQMGVPA